MFNKTFCSFLDQKVGCAFSSDSHLPEATAGLSSAGYKQLCSSHVGSLFRVLSELFGLLFELCSVVKKRGFGAGLNPEEHRTVVHKFTFCSRDAWHHAKHNDMKVENELFGTFPFVCLYFSVVLSEIVSDFQLRNGSS